MEQPLKPVLSAFPFLTKEELDKVCQDIFDSSKENEKPVTRGLRKWVREVEQTK